MTAISWSQFEKNQSAKDISFESFCFQVAYIQYRDYGFFENFFNTPGSEFYLKLHTDCPDLNLSAGDEIGWQVKWWFNSEENTSLTKARRDELETGFKTTLKRHSDIKLWIVCTPGRFVEDTFKKLKTALNKLSSQTNIIHWHKASFENMRSASFEKFGALFHHYFNSHFIGFEFLKEYSERRISDLRKKFDTDLYTPSHYDDEILFVIDYKRIFNELEISIKYMNDDVDSIEANDLFNKNDYRSYRIEYIQKAYELLHLVVLTSKKVIEIISTGVNIEKGKLLYNIIQDHVDKYRKLADFLNKQLNTKGHLINEDEEDQVEKWHHQEYIIVSINKLQSHLVSRDDDDINSTTILGLLDSLFQKDIHLLSSAGFGKTNIACNICHTCLKNGVPSLLILGSAFRRSDKPQKMILQEQELEPKYSFKGFLQALDTLGFSKGVKIPIIIDGLNESKPYDDIWRSNIKDIIRDIENLDYVILITTCRDRYIESIFEETDLSKIRNTRFLKGLSDKQRIEAIPKYFAKYGIEPTNWNFNKDLFVNPLLLKIFSEVNQNEKGIHISLENVFASIDRYFVQIEKRASTKNSTVDSVLSAKLQTRIEEYCSRLWESDSREIPLMDFHRIIAPESESMTDSLTDKLLDEGLCFQTNITAGNETVQFTYDLVAGYAIASKVLLKSVTNPSDLASNLRKLGVDNKLFAQDNGHPLRQDILMSLLHLLPAKYGVHLFEVFDVEAVTEECFNNVDYFINNGSGQKKLLDTINNVDRTGRNFKLLFEKLFENMFKKEIYGLEEFTINVLTKLNQTEVDVFWSELIRKNRSDVYRILVKINKKFCNQRMGGQFDPSLYVCFLSTTSSDKTIRSVATENLFLIANRHSKEIIKLTRLALAFKDLNSLESVMIAICGSALSLKSKEYTRNCLDFIENEFIPALQSTHICIIDYILTIAEFGKYYFGLDYLDRIKFNESYFITTKDQSIEEELGKEYTVHFPHLFGLDLYDFKKHQISGISSDRFHKRETYSTIECLALISANMKRRGYDEAVFDEIAKDFREDRHYKYGREANDNLTVYPEKYLWQAYYELVGFLVLTNKLKPKDTHRYRNEYNFFDPTFPRLPKRFQIVTECFFPSDGENVQEWINSDRIDFIDDLLVHNLYTKTEWVLLSLNITQEGRKNDTRINLSLHSFLIPEKNIKKFSIEIHRGYHDSSGSFHNLYAGEIGWSPFTTTTEQSYYEEDLGLIQLMHDYNWTSWTSNRMNNPSFKFLNSIISRQLKLEFNSTDLSYYQDEEQVTKIVWTENAELYYAKRNIIEEIISNYGLELIWLQFISKYGEFGKYQEKELNPSYKNLRRIIRWNEIQT